MPDIVVTFPGGSRVDAQVGAHLIRTDQPVHLGGEDSAPTPFTTFLASIGACAGIYVLGFLRQRGLPTDQIRLVQSLEVNPLTKMVSLVAIDIQLPPDFPEKYRQPLIRAAEQCAVKKHLEAPPRFEVRTSLAV